MPDKASVFISYSRRDGQFAAELLAAFERAGRAAWLDKDDIRPTAKWANEIAAAIDSADAIVCVLSPDFASSEECAKEIKRAAEQRKRLVPVVARLVEPRAVPASLAELQWISFGDGSQFETAFETLSKALDTDLDWVLEHTRYHVRAAEWDAKGRPSSLVLRGKDLKQSESWLANGSSKDPQPSLLHSQYIAAGRHAATRIQRLVGGALATGLVVAVALAIFAFVQRFHAQVARDDAVSRLYTLQLSRAEGLLDNDPGAALSVLDETVRTAGRLRDFTWDLDRRLGDRLVLALGGVWDEPSKAGNSATPVLAISPDGRMIATGSARTADPWGYSDQREVSEVLVWDVDSGAQLARLAVKHDKYDHDIRIAAIAFAVDGRSLVASAGSARSEVRVWDVATWQERMTAENEHISSLILTPLPLAGDANPAQAEALIGIRSFDKAVLWDTLQSGVEPREIDLSSPYAVARDRDGALVTADPREIVRWNLVTGARAASRNPARLADVVSLAADATRFAAAQYDTIWVWAADGASGWAGEWTLTDGHAETVTSLEFSPSGRVLASGGNDTTVRLWDLERGSVALTLRGPTDDVVAMAFAADGGRLAAGAEDGTVFVWDVAAPPRSPRSIEFSNQASCFAATTQRAAVLAAEGRTLTLRRDRGLPTSVTLAEVPLHCGLAENGTTAFAVTGDSHVAVWPSAEPERSVTIGPIGDPQSVHVSPSGALVAAFVAGDRIGVWDAASGTPRGTIAVEGELEAPFDFMTDALLVGHVRNGEKTQALLWDTQTLAAAVAVTVPAADAQAFAVCRNKPLLASTEFEKLRLVDLQAGTMQERPWYQRSMLAPLREAGALAFSPDCETLAIGDDVLGEVALWDTGTVALRRTILAHTGQVIAETSSASKIGTAVTGTTDGVTALAFSPDGATLASGGGSRRGHGELRLWSVASGDRLAALPASRGSVTSLRFTEDGRALGAVLEPDRSDGDARRAALELWSTADVRQLALIAAHTAQVTRLRFSPDGGRLATEDADDMRKVWDLSGAKPLELGWWARLAAARWPPEPDRSVALSPDGRTRVEFSDNVLLAYEDGNPSPRLFKPEDPTRAFHLRPVVAVRMLPDGRLLSLAADSPERGAPAEIKLWDMSAGRPLLEALEQGAMVTDLVPAPGGEIFVTIGSVGAVLDHPGFVHVWDARELRLIESLRGHRARVITAAFSPDGKRLATGDIDGFVRLWDLAAAAGSTPGADARINEPTSLPRR